MSAKCSIFSASALWAILICAASCCPTIGKAIRCGRITRSRGRGFKGGVEGFKVMSESELPGEITAVAEGEGQPAGPRRMVLNMGPQPPSTHGVLRLVIELDGEIVVKCQPELGYLHTGIEKEFEVKTY